SPASISSRRHPASSTASRSIPARDFSTTNDTPGSPSARHSQSCCTARHPTNQEGTTMAKRTEKKPFVSKSERLEGKIKAVTPISSLTVSDLVNVLGQLGTGKNVWDGKDWQKDDFDGPNKPWKEGKEINKDIIDKGKEKDFKEHKDKREIKELKAEKIENDGVFDPFTQPDPRIDQVIRALTGMSTRIDQLADQIRALTKNGRSRRP